MSDDEYFDDDDIFTSAELDNIPLLNQPSETQAIRTVASSSTAVLVHDTPGATRSNPIVIPNESSNVASGSSTRQHMDGSRNVQQRSAPSTSNPVNHSNQSSGSRRPLQNQGRPAGNRFSAIMTALQRSTQSGSSSEQPLVSKKSIFGAPNDLLRASSPRPSSHSSRNKRDSPSSSDGSGGSVTPRKRARRSPSRGKKRRRSSSCSLSSKAHLDTIAQDSKAQGKEEVWGIIEEESTCAICYDIYVAPQLTPCGHTACAPCIKLWLARKSSCPICRTALNPSQKLTNNLYCANIIDRLFSDAPEWCVGGTKRVEWDKRKQSWDQQASAINVRQYQPIPARPPPGVYGPPPAVARRPLFNPESDSDGEDTDYEYADVYNLPQNIFYVFD